MLPEKLFFNMLFTNMTRKNGTNQNIFFISRNVFNYMRGRFLSPDNFVQDPGSTQDYNRYSYCGNNPLSYTDPSGWIKSMTLTEAYNYFMSNECPNSGTWVNIDGGDGGDSETVITFDSNEQVEEAGYGINSWSYT